MQTQSIVQSSANVIRIVNLKVGDIYKRYNDSSYDSSFFFGIVKSIDNNGEKTFIHAVEFKKSYGTISASIYIIRGDKDVDIFPANLEDFKDEFNSVLDSTAKEIEKLEKQIIEKKEIIKDAQDLIDGTFCTVLTTPEFRELPQQEFNQKRAERITELAKQSETFSDF